MHKYLVTIIESKTHTLKLHTIWQANSEGQCLAELNIDYPQYKLYETGTNPEFRCYISFWCE